MSYEPIYCCIYIFNKITKITKISDLLSITIRNIVRLQTQPFFGINYQNVNLSNVLMTNDNNIIKTLIDDKYCTFLDNSFFAMIQSMQSDHKKCKYYNKKYCNTPGCNSVFGKCRKINCLIIKIFMANFWHKFMVVIFSQIVNNKE